VDIDWARPLGWVALKIKVDRNLCIGVGNCVVIAPTVFELDEENKAVVLDPSSVDDDTLMEAAESCPEKAIIVEDDEGRQLYP
jgi:ferredoxin